MVEIFIRASGCVQGETAVGLLPALGVALTTEAEVRGIQQGALCRGVRNFTRWDVKDMRDTSCQRSIKALAFNEAAKHERWLAEQRGEP
jgi:hypothetical protein